MKKTASQRTKRIDTGQAERLDRSISALMREFKLTPNLLAGSVYADLHVNDLNLLEVLAAREGWTVNQVAAALSAPITTVSSALDRLDRVGLVERKRISSDRRVVQIELTAEGKQLTARIHDRHIGNCNAMLARLAPDQREDFLRMMEEIAQDS
jgi:DNA-binding MarR family transcriptional regulator